MDPSPLKSPQSPKAPYQVTAVDKFDFYESSGVPTQCRDAAHARSVAIGMLERSLAHEHDQAKDPADAAELFDRWNSFGDYPSIYPALDPPFSPSEYARQRAAEMCSPPKPSIRPENVISAADFPPGTKFFEIEDIPIAWPPGVEPVNAFNGKRGPLSHRTSMKLAYEHEITPEKFDSYVTESISRAEEYEPQAPREVAEDEQDEDGCDPNCYAFHSEDSYPVGQLIAAIRRLMNRADLTAETAGKLQVFLFAMERLPLVTPGVRMSLGLRLDQGGESDWREIRLEDDTFTLGRGSWVDGDADTETVFEVGPGYRGGDAFQASNFAQSFLSCAEDVCREVVIDDSADKPFDGWKLERDKSRWGSLPCSFL